MKSVQLTKREGCVIVPSGRHRAGYFLLWSCLSSSGKKPAPQVRVTPAHPCQCSAGGLTPVQLQGWGTARCSVWPWPAPAEQDVRALWQRGGVWRGTAQTQSQA